MIIKISAIGLASLFLYICVKKSNPENSIVIIIAACVIIFLLIKNDLLIIFGEISAMAKKSNIPNNYIKLIIKVIGIGYLSELCASVAKDAGVNSIASTIEIAARISITVLSLPLYIDLINMITGLL